MTGQFSDTTPNDLAGMILGAARGVGYVGLALGPGLLLVVLGLWREELSDRRTRQLLWAGLSLLVVSTVSGMLFQGCWPAGSP